MVSKTRPCGLGSMTKNEGQLYNVVGQIRRGKILGPGHRGALLNLVGGVCTAGSGPTFYY